MKKRVLLFSCEHAVNTIPAEFQSLFNTHQKLLQTHRGYDLGALEISLHLKEIFNCELIQASTSRLLIDCNRSVRYCFSEITNPLPAAEKAKIMSLYYLPYQRAVEHQIESYIKQYYQVIHCSIHSFTPVLNGIERTAEIGFLYDPRRSNEKIFAHQWCFHLQQEVKEYRIRKNYPYKGTSDGLTTLLRKKFSAEDYIGIEVEANQKLVLESHSLDKVKYYLTNSLTSAITAR